MRGVCHRRSARLARVRAAQRDVALDPSGEQWPTATAEPALHALVAGCSCCGPAAAASRPSMAWKRRSGSRRSRPSAASTRDRAACTGTARGRAPWPLPGQRVGDSREPGAQGVLHAAAGGRQAEEGGPHRGGAHVGGDPQRDAGARHALGSGRAPGCGLTRNIVAERMRKDLVLWQAISGQCMGSFAALRMTARKPLKTATNGVRRLTVRTPRPYPNMRSASLAHAC